jgi:DNA repair protein RadC
MPEKKLYNKKVPTLKRKTAIPNNIVPEIIITSGSGRFQVADMFTASIHQLTQVKGIGFVKACQVKAAFELWKRTVAYYDEDHPEITSIGCSSSSSKRSVASCCY